MYMKNFPEVIPIFPLSGVIYFPKTNLPLNIFEQRYLNLVNDAYNKDKLIGMIQFKKEDNAVYDIGCLGKISDFQKSDDGRILINLTGISRFKILKEVYNNKLYREFKVDYKNFVSKVSIISENEGHHPDITFGWGYAKIKIFTHAIKGLAESDFILAAKIDNIN